MSLNGKFQFRCLHNHSIDFININFTECGLASDEQVVYVNKIIPLSVNEDISRNIHITSDLLK